MHMLSKGSLLSWKKKAKKRVLFLILSWLRSCWQFSVSFLNEGNAKICCLTPAGLHLPTASKQLDLDRDPWVFDLDLVYHD